MFARNTSWCSIQQSVFTPRVFWHHTCWVWIEISTFFKCDDAQFDPHRNFCPFHCPNMLRQKMLKTRSSSNGSLPAGWFSINQSIYVHVPVVVKNRVCKQTVAATFRHEEFECCWSFCVPSHLSGFIFPGTVPKKWWCYLSKNFSCASLCFNGPTVSTAWRLELSLVDRSTTQRPSCAGDCMISIH